MHQLEKPLRARRSHARASRLSGAFPRVLTLDVFERCDSNCRYRSLNARQGGMFREVYMVDAFARRLIDKRVQPADQFGMGWCPHSHRTFRKRVPNYPVGGGADDEQTA